MSLNLLHAAMTTKNWTDVLDLFKNNPLGFKSKPVLHTTDNNSGPIQIAQSPEAAVTEAITNGLDAMIVSRMNSIVAAGVSDVIGSVRYLIENGDTVFLQCSGKNGDLTVQIGDTGCGMTEKGLMNGPLALGSTEKPVNGRLHGNYGMGGLANFARSKASLIVTRALGSEDYVFTFVWKDRLPSGIESYRFATDQNGRLFRAPASQIIYVLPKASSSGRLDPQDASLIREDNGFSVPRKVKTFARLILREPRNTLVVLHAMGIPSLPEFGTIRRQFGMDLDYYANRDNDGSIYNAFLDRMFGSEATLTLMTDSATRWKDYTTRHCRRIVLDGMFDQDSAPKQARPAIRSAVDKFKPLWRAPVQEMEIKIGKHIMQPATIRAWVLDNGLDGEKVANPVGYWLTGHGKSCKGLFVTSNGQTHSRIQSMQIVRDAGYPFLCNNLIIEVAIDKVNLATRPDIFASNRENLQEAAEEAIRKEVVEWLKSYSGKLGELNAQMAPKKSDAASVEDVQKQVSAFLHNPMFAKLLSLGTGRRIIYGDDGGDDRPVPGEKPERKLLPLVNPPTVLKVPGQITVQPGTFYLPIISDAEDSNYAKAVTIISSDPSIKVRTQPSKLTNGEMRVQMECAAPIGTTVTLTVTMRGNKSGPQTCLVIVADRKARNERKGVEKPMQKGGIPPFEVEFIDPSHASFGAIFTDLGPDSNRVDSAFTYLPKGDGSYACYINAAFKPYTTVRDTMEKVQEGAAERVKAEFQKWCVVVSTCMVLSEKYPNGVSTNEEHRMLAQAMHGMLLVFAVNEGGSDVTRAASVVLTAAA